MLQIHPNIGMPDIKNMVIQEIADKLSPCSATYLSSAFR